LIELHHAYRTGLLTLLFITLLPLVESDLFGFLTLQYFFKLINFELFLLGSHLFNSKIRFIPPSDPFWVSLKKAKAIELLLSKISLLQNDSNNNHEDLAEQQEANEPTDAPVISNPVLILPAYRKIEITLDHKNCLDKNKNNPDEIGTKVSSNHFLTVFERLLGVLE